MLHTLTWTLILGLYAPIFSQLYRSAWYRLDYTHAYFILPVALWLVWRSRYQWGPLLERPRPRASLFQLSMLVFGLLLYFFGWRFGYLSISTVSLVPVLYGMVSFLYGGDIAKALSFPILYLLLLVPPPVGILDAITLPMRHGVSVVTQAILTLVGYPITRQGLLLSIGNHDIFMGQPCSGFRSLITMLSLGLIYVHLTKGRMKKRLLLVASIVPLALLGNLVRIIALCLITYYFGEAIGQGFFHYFSGLVIFVIIILGLIVLERVLGKAQGRIGRFKPLSPA